MRKNVILLVEDNPDDAELTRLAFQKSHLRQEVVVVQDGAEALDYIFGTGAYDGRDVNVLPTVVLLDIKLPKVNGFEVLRRLRTDRRTDRLPVVLLTSSREAQDLRQGYALGANSYIVKPIEFEKFIHTVGQLGSYWTLLNEPLPGMGDR
jgi:two-component system response regulator